MPAPFVRDLAKAIAINIFLIWMLFFFVRSINVGDVNNPAPFFLGFATWILISGLEIAYLIHRHEYYEKIEKAEQWKKEYMKQFSDRLQAYKKTYYSCRDGLNQIISKINNFKAEFKTKEIMDIKLEINTVLANMKMNIGIYENSGNAGNFNAPKRS